MSSFRCHPRGSAVSAVGCPESRVALPGVSAESVLVRLLNQLRKPVFPIPSGVKHLQQPNDHSDDGNRPPFPIFKTRQMQQHKVAASRCRHNVLPSEHQRSIHIVRKNHQPVGTSFRHQWAIPAAQPHRAMAPNTASELVGNSPVRTISTGRK